MTEALPMLDLSPVFRIGRRRQWHLARVLIESDATGRPQVVVRSRCGLERVDWTETYGVPTCDACITDRGAA